MEAALASEVTKIDVRSNMHLDTRAIEASHFKSEVNFEAIEAVSRPHSPHQRQNVLSRQYVINMFHIHRE